MARTRAYPPRPMPILNEIFRKTPHGLTQCSSCAPALKGSLTFFHQNVFNKPDESRAAPRINMLKDACMPLGKNTICSVKT